MKEKIGNIYIDFIEAYNNEVTPEKIKHLEDAVEKIDTIEAKIDFLKDEKLKYLNHIAPEILDVSGRVDLPNLKNKPLFFDRIIQNHIDNLEGRNQYKKIEVSDPLELIDKDILPLFIDAEKKATTNTLKFSSEIRCAAFCEQLFIRNYFTTKRNGKKQDRTIQKKFAFIRYGMDIKTGFLSKNKIERNKHVINKVDGLEPLKNCF